MKDYGADPLPNGMFKMHPSGDIVDFAERMRRLPPKKTQKKPIFGMTWDELERRQGGKLKRD